MLKQTVAGLALLASLWSTPGLAQTALVVPAVAGEISLDQIATPNDDKLSCEAMRSEIQTLVEVTRRHEQAAEKLQAETVDRAAAARDAARNQERAAAQDAADKARIAAKTVIPVQDVKFDPNNPPAQKSEPTLDGKPITSAAFQPAQTLGLTPTQMRQYHLVGVAYAKGC